MLFAFTAQYHDCHHHYSPLRALASFVGFVTRFLA